VSIAYLDTHVAVYLHDGLVEKLSREAKRQIEGNDLLISPMVFLEFDYLFRRKRVSAGAEEIYRNLNADFGVSLCSVPFARIAWEALNTGWTQDPFDRIIVAQAAANHRAALITRDELIRENYNQAVW
jgi:PIN domain nuclease of toxin-antitoxin system